MSIPQPGATDGFACLGVVTADVGPARDWVRVRISETVHLFSLLVFDPEDRLRVQYWGKQTSEEVVIAADEADGSCATVPGPLPQGRWRIEVYGDPGGTCWSVRADSGVGPVPSGSLPSVGVVRWARKGPRLPELDPSVMRRPARAGRAWYRGDFHAHTRASDGSQSAAELTSQARARGLDFFTVTEHNLLTTDWPATDVLVVPGTEVTSPAGHFNAVGLHRWLDWRPHAGDGGCATARGMRRLMAQAREQGAVVSVNHPVLEPWEWGWADTPLDAFDALEIWNDPTYPANAEALAATLRLWTSLWDDGHAVVGVGGSDTHLRPGDSYVPGGPPALIGDPWTGVLAENLSADAIVEGVRAGRVLVSRGPLLDVTAEVGGEVFPPGASLTAALASRRPADRWVRLLARADRAPAGAMVRWVGNGGAVLGGASVTAPWDATTWRWARAEVRGSDGTLLAVSNPISAGRGVRRHRLLGEMLAGAGGSAGQHAAPVSR